MKRVTNKELISVILINIGALAFAIYIWLIYDHRQTIINSEEPIQNYSVLEVNCYRKSGSNILIEFKGKQYYVEVVRDKCPIWAGYSNGSSIRANKSSGWTY